VMQRRQTLLKSVHQNDPCGCEGEGERERE
jgi:hypothetical protein